MAKKKYLNEAERDALIQAYAEDKLNNPPANITDKTLIENYGDDVLKSRLLIEGYDVENPTGTPTPPTNPETPETPGTPIVPEQNAPENPPVIETPNNEGNQNFEGTNAGNSNDENIQPSVETGNVPETPIVGNVEDAPNGDLLGSDPKAAEYAKSYNDYIRLFGRRPFSGHTLEQIQKEIDNEINGLEEKAKEASRPASKLENEETPAGKIKIKNVHDGREIFVTQHSWDNFISKNQPEWKKAAKPPIEILK